MATEYSVTRFDRRAGRTLELKDQAGRTEFSMRELYSGLLAGPITRSIPDMTEPFGEYADTL
jgi:hypothetical protein